MKEKSTMNMRDSRKGKLEFFQFVKKGIRDMEDGDYVMLEGSMSSLHLESLGGSQEEKKPGDIEENI